MTWNSHPNINEILRVPGYLFLNPTGTAAEADWGTKLGFAEKGVEVKVDYKTVLLDEEDSGLDWTLKVFTGCNVKIMAILKNWNANVLSQLFPGMSTLKKIIIRSAIKTGTVLSSATYTDKILFVPDDRTNNPCFILRKASGNIMAAMEFHRGKDTGFPVAWDGFDSSGVFWLGLLSELSV